MKAHLVILAIALGVCPDFRLMSQTTAGSPGESGTTVPAPPVLVYKTRGDYFNLVPVFLSDDKQRIVSYPHPDDLRSLNGYRLPVLLKKGYLLDKKGIGKNVAFLRMTYADYAGLPHPPSLEELDKLILDRDPLLEMYECGNFSPLTDPVNQLNRLIKHHKLQKTCRKIK